jgi:type II secretory pathway component PulJ
MDDPMLHSSAALAALADEVRQHKAAAELAEIRVSDQLVQLENRIERRISEIEERQGKRIGTMETAHLLKLEGLAAETRVLREDVVVIHGRNGTNGKIGALTQSVDSIKSSLKEAAAESRASRRANIAIAVGLLMAILGGVYTMRDRITTIEVEGARQKESARETETRLREQLDRVERRIETLVDRFDRPDPPKIP